MLRRLLPRLLDSGAPMRLAALMTPRGGAVELRGLRYGEGPRRLLDLTLPKGADAATPLLVFFHGGGWQTGSRADYVFLARAFAAEGIAVALPDYGLWPTARWPDFIEDGAAALAWLRCAPQAPRGPLFVMGHSAGGFIAAALSLDPRWLGAAGLPGGRSALAGAVLVAAPIAWQPTDEPIRSIFAPAPGGRIEAAPEAAALRGAPPHLLIHGSADTVVGPFHSERLAQALREAGSTARLHREPGAGHIAPMVAMSAPALRWGWTRPDTWQATLRFLRDTASRGSAA